MANLPSFPPPPGKSDIASRDGAVTLPWGGWLGALGARVNLLTRRIDDGVGVVGRVRCVRSTNLSIPNSTATLVAWNAEDYDTAALHDLVTNPSRITAPAGAVTAEIRAYAAFAVNGVGVRGIDILRNSAGVIIPANSIAAGGSTGAAAVGFYATTGRRPVAPDDHFEVVVIQNSGGALNLLGPAGAQAAPSYFEAVFYAT